MRSRRCIELLLWAIQILANNQQTLGQNESTIISKNQTETTIALPTQLQPTTMASAEESISFTGQLSTFSLDHTFSTQDLTPTYSSQVPILSKAPISTSEITIPRTRSEPSIILLVSTRSVTIESMLQSYPSSSQKAIQSSVIILPTQKSEISHVWLTSTSGGVTVLVTIGLLSLIIILLLIVLLCRKSDQRRKPCKFGYGPDLNLEEEIGKVNLRELSNADVETDDLPPPLTDGELENIKEPVPTSTQLNNSCTIEQKDNEHLI